MNDPVMSMLQAEIGRLDSEKQAAEARARLLQQHREWLIEQLRPMIDSFNRQQLMPKVERVREATYVWGARDLFYVKEFRPVQLVVDSGGSVFAQLKWEPTCTQCQDNTRRKLVDIPPGCNGYRIAGQLYLLPVEAMEALVKELAPLVVLGPGAASE